MQEIGSLFFQWFVTSFSAFKNWRKRDYQQQQAGNCPRHGGRQIDKPSDEKR